MSYVRLFEDIPVDLAPSSAGNVNVLYNSETVGKGDYINSYPPSKVIDKAVLDEICAKIAKKAELKSLQPSNKLSAILNKSFKDVATNNEIELTIVTNEKGQQLLSLLGDKGGKKESTKERYKRLFENQDSFREEAWRYIQSEFKGLIDPKDLEEEFEVGLYWYAHDYYDGQADELYSILSTSPYKPGPTMSGVEDEGEIAEMIYNALVESVE